MPLDPSLGVEAPASIHRSGATPYYVQLAEILRDQVRRGIWKPGDLLPSEADLGTMYDISRTAVRQALDELVAEGLVEKEKGKGSFVAHPRTAQFIVQEVRGFNEEMTSKGFTVQTRILEQSSVQAPKHVSDELGITRDSQVVMIDRVRSADNTPIVHVVTYLPLPRFEALGSMDLSGASLYSVLGETFGVIPTGGRRQIDAVAAAREKSELLQVEVGSPLLRMSAVNMDQHGVPFEYFRAWYRGDLASFDIEVSGGHD